MLCQFRLQVLGVKGRGFGVLSAVYYGFPQPRPLESPFLGSRKLFAEIRSKLGFSNVEPGSGEIGNPQIFCDPRPRSGCSNIRGLRLGVHVIRTMAYIRGLYYSRAPCLWEPARPEVLAPENPTT